MSSFFGSLSYSRVVSAYRLTDLNAKEANRTKCGLSWIHILGTFLVSWLVCDSIIVCSSTLDVSTFWYQNGVDQGVALA